MACCFVNLKYQGEWQNCRKLFNLPRLAKEKTVATSRDEAHGATNRFDRAVILSLQTSIQEAMQEALRTGILPFVVLIPKELDLLVADKIIAVYAKDWKVTRDDRTLNFE